jgi:competence protein ComEA
MRKAFLLALVCLIGFVGALSAGQTGKAGAAKAKPANVKEELRVDLNHADAAELAKLPGIGEQVAKRIIAYRTDNGPFQKTEELMNVRGIGEKTYLKLRPMLTLGTEKEPSKK